MKVFINGHDYIQAAFYITSFILLQLACVTIANAIMITALPLILHTQ